MEYGGSCSLLEYFFLSFYYFYITGCDLRSFSIFFITLYSDKTFRFACRCLRCVQGAPQVSWWRAQMTKAVLPSGTWCDVNSLEASVTAEQVILFLHRMEDKGEVKCIKFSIGNKILAVQRTPKSVVRIRSSCLLCWRVKAGCLWFLSFFPHTLSFIINHPCKFDSSTWCLAGFYQLYSWLCSHRVHAGM